MSSIIYETIEWDREVTFVAFGGGRVKIGIAHDTIGQQMVIFSEYDREMPIGVQDGDKSFFDNCGRTIVFGFNKPESIDVVMDFLQQAKTALSGVKRE